MPVLNLVAVLRQCRSDDPPINTVAVVVTALEYQMLRPQDGQLLHQRGDTGRSRRFVWARSFEDPHCWRHLDYLAQDSSTARVGLCPEVDPVLAGEPQPFQGGSHARQVGHGDYRGSDHVPGAPGLVHEDVHQAPPLEVRRDFFVTTVFGLDLFPPAGTFLAAFRFGDFGGVGCDRCEKGDSSVYRLTMAQPV
ncbi:hypothetical protein IW249_001173 [Micromonospora vinacea]|uniref:Uncharacterized protein n=1 Tax=Micromonospora vinacea TaxID=709878 RepID=A0ABS0JWM5_9ACTN|nr:hypothetical protein [Micromonospora vinacea]MBG6100759.1 hypothetical protein [Micromonospora vinacea]